MKVLFLSITAGQGHNQAAKAVIDYLSQKNVECALLDTFEYINPILSGSVDKGYLVSTKFTPAVYGRMYRIAEKQEKDNAKFSIAKLTNSILSKKLTVYIKKFNPDVIVCTHIFAAQIMSHLKNKGLVTKVIGIVTDFTIHPFWQDTNLDYYITANELLNLQAEKKGISNDKIRPIGIPIHMKFAQKIDHSKARALLGIEDKTTIFVMSGSMGYGNVVNVIRQIDKLDLDFQIVSVCGNNKALRRKIDGIITEKKIYNYGFVDNVDVIMDASTCIVSKPGGLTISESLAKGLPMVLMNPIPGQEDRNVEFLLNNGIAVRISKTFPVDEAIYQLLFNNSRIKHLNEMIKNIGKPNSSKDLGDLIIKMGEKVE